MAFNLNGFYTDGISIAVPKTSSRKRPSGRTLPYERSYLQYLDSKQKNEDFEHFQQSLLTSNGAYGHFWSIAPVEEEEGAEQMSSQAAGLASQSEELDRIRTASGRIIVTGQPPPPVSRNVNTLKLPHIVDYNRMLPRNGIYPEYAKQQGQQAIPLREYSVPTHFRETDRLSFPELNYISNNQRILPHNNFVTKNDKFIPSAPLRSRKQYDLTASHERKWDDFRDSTERPKVDLSQSIDFGYNVPPDTRHPGAEAWGEMTNPRLLNVSPNSFAMEDFRYIDLVGELQDGSSVLLWTMPMSDG